MPPIHPRRRNITEAFSGVSASSFCSLIYQWVHLSATQPTTPKPDLGFTYVINNHGMDSYISASQSMQLSILTILSVVSFIIAALVAGPVPRKLPWELYRPYVNGPGWLFALAFLACTIVLASLSYNLSSVLVQKGFSLSLLAS
jgi:hypothetical protein